MIPTPDNILALDTETTGLWPWSIQGRESIEFPEDRPFAVSGCNSEGTTFFIRAKVNPKTREVNWPKNRKWQDLQNLLSNSDLLMICHHAAFDLNMLESIGIRPKCQIADTWIMAHVCNPAEYNFMLCYLADKYLGITREDEHALDDVTKKVRREAKKKGYLIATQDSHGKKPHKADFWLSPPETLEEYAAKDTIRAMLLYLFYKEALDRDEEEGGKLWNIYNQEIRTLHTLRRMQHNGLTCKPERLLEVTNFYRIYLNKQRRKAAKLGHGDLNFQSNKQMQEAFCYSKGLHTTQYTDAGNPKIDSEQLLTWANEGDKLARVALEWKAAKKSLEFLDSYKYHLSTREDGSYYIHFNSRQAGPVTGRLSSHDPNLQQIPKTDDNSRASQVDARLRECFGPRRGYVWYLPDYSQMEIWTCAFLSGDPSLQEALLSGRDFHSETANRAFGSEPTYKTDPGAWRKRAKTVFFCYQYGGGPRKIAQILRCPYEDAKDFVRVFDENLPGIKAFSNRLISQVRREGYILNAFGRRYYIHHEVAYRALDYIVQGSCADIMKRALVNLDKFFSRTYPEIDLSCTIHDEIIMELPRSLHRSEGSRIQRHITRIMQKDSHRIGIPHPHRLPIEIKMTGTVWSEAKEVA